MGAIITLTTDFGLADGYVAAVKGVLLDINPEAKLVDVSHMVRPQDIGHGSFILSTTCPYFPRGTIHLVVVDPGVGTEREAIILKKRDAYFVAPDNGVLSDVIADCSSSLVITEDKRVALGGGLEAFALTRPEYWRKPVDPTFHGRDIFAPVAAHLSLGRRPEEMGERLSSLAMLPLACPRREGHTLIGHIRNIDYFGNLITSIRRDDLLSSGRGVNITLHGHTIKGLSRTYAEGDDLLALIGSSGRLEVARRNGSAREYLGAAIGDEVHVRAC